MADYFCQCILTLTIIIPAGIRLSYTNTHCQAIMPDLVKNNFVLTVHAK